MKTLKKTMCAFLAMLLFAACLTACSSKGPDPVNTSTCTYDEMVAYLTAKGYIAKDTTPVDINTTAGYVTDNTGGQLPVVTIADKAEDYGGLWLFWWDTANPTENYETYTSMASNGGVIVYMGGAAIMETKANSGNFAIAFAEGYDKADSVLADFKALPKA